MTKSRFEGDKNPWSVVPLRAFADDKLRETDLRVLGAICTFVNRAGVCWPAMMTIAELAGLKQRQSVHNSLKRLKAGKYVRQLQPKDFQETASGWKGNRYQVLWDGDEPLPTYEDLHVASFLQWAEPPEIIPEEKGSGDWDDLARSLTHAYLRAVQRRTGQTRRFDNEINHARRLAEQGATVDQVTAATEALCLSYLAERRGIPSLADVARQGVTQSNERLP